MTGTDPAVHAARQMRRLHLESVGITDVKPGYEGATPEEIAAAREALAPIRRILDDYDGDPINAIEAIRTHLEGGTQ